MSSLQDRELSASPPPSQSSIGPQLQQTTTASAPSPSQAEQATSITDASAAGIATASTELNNNNNNSEDDEQGTTVPDSTSTALAPPTTAQTMAGIGSLTTLHDSDELDAGYASYYNPRRILTIQNDNFADLYDHNANYVRRVYTAITTTPASMDDDQTKMVNAFTKKLQTFGGDADQYLADISSMIVAAIYRLHSEGDYLFGPQFQVLKPRPADSTMTATERMDCICDLLHMGKSYIIDLMEGSDAITRFVAAPRGASERKARNKGSNNQRAKKTKELKQLQGTQGEADEDDAEEDVDEQPEDSRSKGKHRAGARTKAREARAGTTAVETAEDDEAQEADDAQPSFGGETLKPSLGKRKRRKV